MTAEFESTIVGRAPCAWQRIYIKDHSDAKDRLRLARTCTAARDLVLQNSPRLKLRVALHKLGSSDEALARTLRCLQQALRARGPLSSTLVIQQPPHQGHDRVLTTLTTLAPEASSVHALHLEVGDVPTDVITAAASAFPSVKQLVLSTESASLAHLFLEDLLLAVVDVSAPGVSHYHIDLPPPSLLPHLTDLTIHEDVHNRAGKVRVSGLGPYLPQLHRLHLGNRHPWDPVNSVFTSVSHTLRHLQLHWLSDKWLQALLVYAPRLDTITAYDLDLQRSHAESQCSWRRVTLQRRQNLHFLAWLPHRESGRLGVHLAQSTAINPWEEPRQYGVLDLSVAYEQDAPITMLTKFHSLSITGVQVLDVQPTVDLVELTSSDQCAAVRRHLPLLTALWQPSYSLNISLWYLTGDLLHTLLHVATALRATDLAVVDCSTRELTPQDYTLPADTPPLTCTSITLDALTDGWLGLLLEHAPHLRTVDVGRLAVGSGGVGDDTAGSVSSAQGCRWQRLTVRRMVWLPQLLHLPRCADGHKLTVECVRGVACPETEEECGAMDDMITQLLGNVDLVIKGFIFLLAPEHTPACTDVTLLRAQLSLAAKLPWPGRGVTASGWRLSDAVIAELQHLPQWPVDEGGDSGSDGADAPASDSGEVVAAESTGGSGAVAAESTGGSGAVAAESTGGSGAAAAGFTGGSGAVAAESTGGSGAVAAESTGDSGAAAAGFTGGSGAVAAEFTGGSDVVAAESTGGSGEVAAESTGDSGAAAAGFTGGSGAVAAESTGGSGAVAAGFTGGSGAVAAEFTGGSDVVAAESTGGSGEVAAESAGGSGAVAAGSTGGSAEVTAEHTAGSGAAPAERTGVYKPMSLSLHGMVWPDDPDTSGLLVDVVPLSYSTLSVDVSDVSEQAAQALCSSACSTRSKEHPVTLEFVAINTSKKWLVSLPEVVWDGGGAEYVKLVVKNVIAIPDPAVVGAGVGAGAGGGQAAQGQEQEQGGGEVQEQGVEQVDLQEGEGDADEQGAEGGGGQEEGEEEDGEGDGEGPVQGEAQEEGEFEDGVEVDGDGPQQDLSRGVSATEGPKELGVEVLGQGDQQGNQDLEGGAGEDEDVVDEGCLAGDDGHTEGEGMAGGGVRDGDR